MFLDRDGTLIEDVGYPSDPTAVRLLPGVLDGLRALRERGHLLVLISNQSGIGRGLITREQAQAVHDHLVGQLTGAGLALDDARYCPHTPEADCDCRKPKPGLILQAAEALNIDLSASVFVGDRKSDVDAGSAGGLHTILLDVKGCRDGAVQSWPDVVHAVDRLIPRRRG